MATATLFATPVVARGAAGNFGCIEGPPPPSGVGVTLACASAADGASGRVPSWNVTFPGSVQVLQYHAGAPQNGTCNDTPHAGSWGAGYLPSEDAYVTVWSNNTCGGTKRVQYKIAGGNAANSGWKTCGAQPCA